MSACNARHSQISIRAPIAGQTDENHPKFRPLDQKELRKDTGVIAEEAVTLVVSSVRMSICLFDRQSVVLEDDSLTAHLGRDVDEKGIGAGSDAVLLGRGPMGTHVLLQALEREDAEGKPHMTSCAHAEALNAQRHFVHVTGTMTCAGNKLLRLTNGFPPHYTVSNR